MDKRIWLFILTAIIAVYGASSDRPRHVDFLDEIPRTMHSSAIMESVPYLNDFESSITGWTIGNRHDPLCSPYCSDIEWNWIANPELIQVAPDIFPDHIDLPEEVIDGLTEAYLPGAYSGMRCWWCGSLINGTFLGDPYDPDYTSIFSPDPYGISYNWMEAWLISPVFNTTGLSEVYMSFWTWWEVEAIDIYSYDIMEVSVSIDGGGWTPIDTLNPPFARLTGWENNHSYSSGGYLQYGHWVLWTYDLSAYAGHGIQIRFFFDTIDMHFNAFRGWFFDDFYIGSGPEYGELDWNVDAPTTISAVDCHFSPNPFDVDFQVWNSGGMSVHDVDAELVLPPGLHRASGDSIANFGDIAPAETMWYSWQILADDSLEGSRCFTIRLTSADSIQGYRDNFDDTTPLLSGDGMFDYTDVGSVSPRAMFPPSGAGIAGVPALGGTFPEADIYALTTVAPFDLTGFTECYIYFWYWMDVRESGFAMQGLDGGIVEINVNGTGWQTLDEFATGMLSPRYTGYIASGSSNPLALQLTYCHDSGGWVHVRSLDLMSLGYCVPGDMLEVRFRFGTGATSPDPSTSQGWFIDDFTISSLSHPAGPYEITQCVYFPLVYPPIAEAFSDTTLCPDEIGTLTGTALGGTPPYSYRWFPTSGLSAPNAQTTFTEPESTTIYFIEITDYYGCRDTDSVVVYMDDLSISVNTETSICFGDSVSASAIISAGFSPFDIDWTPTTGVVSPTSASTQITPPSSDWYVCTVIDDAGCIAVDSFFIEVLPLPEAPSLFYPPDDDSISLGSVNLTWSHTTGDEDFFIVIDGDTLGPITDTFYTFYGTICGDDYTWFIISQNECGDTISEVFTFHVRPCLGPQVTIIQPLPDTWSACISQIIVLEINDDDGIDESSIRLTAEGITYSVDGAILTFDGLNLSFTPPAGFPDGELIEVCLDSCDDMFGNFLDATVCWTFRMDLSTPDFWGSEPSGILDSIPETVWFHLDDTLSGLDEASVVLQLIMDGDTAAFAPGSGILYDGDSFWVELSGYTFEPGDSMTVCVYAEDSPDYCEPNALDTCWIFIIAPCNLRCYACDDASICPGTWLNLGALPSAWGGTTPYSYIWTTLTGDTIATTSNPSVSPETATTYIMYVEDAAGCFARDTVTVYADFEIIDSLVLLAPLAEEMLPPGAVTLEWGSFGGTAPIYYDVIIDGITVATGLTDTFYIFDTDCADTHFWAIEAYGLCNEYIPHCDTSGINWIDSSESIRFDTDTVTNPWGWSGDLPFYTYPCDGPVAYVERPMPYSWTSCYPESIAIRIESPSGVVESSIALEINGTNYDIASLEVNWFEPNLVITPMYFSDYDTVYICLTAVEDTFGNPLTGDSLCWIFYVDFTPPNIQDEYPPDGSIISILLDSLSFVLHHWGSLPDTNSLFVYVDGTPLTEACLDISEFPCTGYCYNINIDSTCFLFLGCDTITISVYVTDSTDYCEDNIMDTSWTFFMDCHGPQAEAVFPPADIFNSCPNDTILIWLWDSLPGIDTATVILNIPGYGIISWGDPRVSYNNDTLMFIPAPPFPDEGTITIDLISADDFLGNETADHVTWTYYIDRLPPEILYRYPSCSDSISHTHPEIVIEPYDSGCGVNLDSAYIVIDDTLIYRYIDGEIDFDGIQLIFNPDDFGLIFPGGSAVSVCWHLEDCAFDLCAPNVLEDCCTFYVSAGGPVTSIRYPEHDYDWLACYPDSILIFIEDEDGVIASSISYEVCYGGDCSDCEFFSFSSTETHGFIEWDDSVAFWFVPEPSFTDGDTICVHILSAEDSLGNPISHGYPDSVIFYVDLSPPIFWNEYPIGNLTEIPTEAGFHIYDSLSGLYPWSITMWVIIDSDSTEFPGWLDTGCDSISFSLASIVFSPTETVQICIEGYDMPDYCNPNVIDTCWTFVTPGCELIADACEDSWICPGNSVELGSHPAATGGIEPYSFVWTDYTGDTLYTVENPLASPESTTVYILITLDSYGCTAFDTVTVHVDFEPVTDCELLFPSADTTLPPGSITLQWHALDGTPPIYYTVYIDGAPVIPDITDTSYTFDVPCGQTHTWGVAAYNICSSNIAHCDTSGVWFESDTTIYWLEEIPNPWGWDDDPPFHTEPCDGPVITPESPGDSTWSACYPESILVIIDDPDGVVDSTIAIEVNGTPYTTASVEVNWSEPYLSYLPAGGFIHSEIVHVCLTAAWDIYGNPIAEMVCWDFGIDRVPPLVDIIEPDSSYFTRDYEQDILFKIADTESGFDSLSLLFLVNWTDYTNYLIHTTDISGDTLWHEYRFIPESIEHYFAPGDTVEINISACDIPDYCGPNCFDILFTFPTVPVSGCMAKPNPFTPDGNLINDVAVFDYPNMYADEAEVTIFNLYGREVFAGKIGPVSDISDWQNRTWNGSDNNGVPLRQGIYIYVITIGDELVCDGTIVIAR